MEMLPTNHGFDEFFGNLYHLNAEEEPEHPDYPEGVRVSRTSRNGSGRAASFTASRMCRSWTTGPLTKSVRKPIDEEVTPRRWTSWNAPRKRTSRSFVLAGTPPAMHIFTTSEERNLAGKTGLRTSCGRHGRA